MNNNVSCNVGPFFAVFLVFLVLKLTNAIAWSWWWVTAPLWIPFGLALVGVIILSIIAFILAATGKSDLIKNSSILKFKSSGK